MLIALKLCNVFIDFYMWRNPAILLTVFFGGRKVDESYLREHEGEARVSFHGEIQRDMQYE